MSSIDVEKARAAQRAYSKAWRAKNKEKVRENNIRYWVRRAEREAAQSAEDGKKVADNG